MDVTNSEELPLAVYYEPQPYWGCPNCGANTWGAENSTDASSEYIYRCHGPTAVGNPYVNLGGCGARFRMPKNAYDEIIWDEWRQDILDGEGKIVIEDVLFIRGTRKDVSYYCPVLYYPPDGDGIEDTKELIELMIDRRQHGN